MLLLKVIIFALVAPGTFVVLIPYLLLALYADAHPHSSRQLGYLGVLPMALGAVVYIRCLWDFAVTGRGTPALIDPPKNLVVCGLYCYVRNPMYIGSVMVLLGEAIWFQSPILFGYSAAVFVAFYLLVLLYEEPTLLRLFGDSYRQYCRSVPRWIPR
jgi:protein-S-isoprenylcysteine O-methyltransferase Ste14